MKHPFRLKENWSCFAAGTIWRPTYDEQHYYLDYERIPGVEVSSVLVPTHYVESSGLFEILPLDKSTENPQHLLEACAKAMQPFISELMLGAYLEKSDDAIVLLELPGRQGFQLQLKWGQVRAFGNVYLVLKKYLENPNAL